MVTVGVDFYPQTGAGRAHRVAARFLVVGRLSRQAVCKVPV